MPQTDVIYRKGQNNSKDKKLSSKKKLSQNKKIPWSKNKKTTINKWLKVAKESRRWESLLSKEESTGSYCNVLEESRVEDKETTLE